MLLLVEQLWLHLVCKKNNCNNCPGDNMITWKCEGLEGLPQSREQRGKKDRFKFM